MRFLDAAGSGIREFPRKNDDLDASGRGWTARHRIRNQQVSGSSPLAGSNRINNLQGSRFERRRRVSPWCHQPPRRRIAIDTPPAPSRRGRLNSSSTLARVSARRACTRCATADQSATTTTSDSAAAAINSTAACHSPARLVSFPLLLQPPRPQARAGRRRRR